MKRLCIAFLVVSMISSFGVNAFANELGNSINIEEGIKQEDTETIENGEPYVNSTTLQVEVLDANGAHIGYESLEYYFEKHGDSVNAQITYGDTVEKISSNLNDDYYTLEVNGVKSRMANRIQKSEGVTTFGYVDDMLGDAYDDVEVASRSFTDNYGARQVMRVKEYYEWHNHRTSCFFEAFTLVRDVIASGFDIEALGVDTLIQDGVAVIRSALTVHIDAYEQNWNKWAEADYDTMHTYHFHAGRTLIANYYKNPNGGGYQETDSDRSNGNFYNNSSILSSAISSYNQTH